MTQPSLFDGAVGAAFEEFHANNPHVYTTFVRLARQWQQTVGGKCGIGALTERVRWELAISTSDPNYKINNNFRAFFARLVMLENPDLAGMFDLRRSAADEWLEARAS